MNTYQQLNIPIPSSAGGPVQSMPFSLADHVRENFDEILEAFVDSARRHSWDDIDIKRTVDAITPENIGDIIPRYLDPVYIDQ